MILSIQYLRALAALMVVLFHAVDGPGRLGEGVDLPSFRAGTAGVDLFFVISGFIIWWTTRGRPVAPGAFLRRRILRVAPLYWILTLLLAGVAIAAPHVLGSTRFDPAHLLASLLFVPWPHPTLGHDNPVLFVGWTLNYEMAFYALFALVLPMEGGRRLAAALALICGLALLGLALPAEGMAGYWTRPIILEFAAGLVLGALAERGWRFSRVEALCVGAAGFALLLWAGTVLPEHAPQTGLAAAIVVMAAVFGRGEAQAAPGAVGRLLVFLGDASYSIYLTHILVLPVLQIAWVRLGLPVAGPAGLLYPLAALAGCAAAGCTCYVLLERPLGALLSGRRKSEPSRRSALA